jgi:hypothetical protein
MTYALIPGVGVADFALRPQGCGIRAITTLGAIPAAA